MYSAAVMSKACVPGSCFAPRVAPVRTRVSQRCAVASVDTASYTKVALKTLSTCELAVSIYPKFKYEASQGGGEGTVTPLEDGRYKLSFPADTLNIPGLSWRTASVFNVPIPPPILIDIKPKKFEGILDMETGQIEMEFDAEFFFSVGPLYAAPPLMVATTLTTESSSGKIYSETGRRLKGGKTRLVGVARVPKVNDWFVDTFLFLPTDALAVMDADLKFS